MTARKLFFASMFIRAFSVCAFIAGISNTPPAHADYSFGSATLIPPKSAEVFAFANYPVGDVDPLRAGALRKEAENEPSDPTFTLLRSDLARFLDSGKLTNVQPPRSALPKGCRGVLVLTNGTAYFWKLLSPTNLLLEGEKTTHRHVSALMVVPYCILSLDSPVEVRQIRRITNGCLDRFPAEHVRKVYEAEINRSFIATGVSESNILHPIRSGEPAGCPTMVELRTLRTDAFAPSLAVSFLPDIGFLCLENGKLVFWENYKSKILLMDEHNQTRLIKVLQK